MALINLFCAENTFLKKGDMCYNKIVLRRANKRIGTEKLRYKKHYAKTETQY